MSPRLLLGMCLVFLLLITACGGDDDGDSNGNGAANTPANTTAATSPPESSSDDDSDAGDLEVNQEYLQGEWCSTRETDPDGTTYVFDGNRFEYGREGRLGSGGNIPTFLIGIRIQSVEQDEFIATEFGREIVFTRGSCSG